MTQPIVSANAALHWRADSPEAQITKLSPKAGDLLIFQAAPGRTDIQYVAIPIPGVHAIALAPGQSLSQADPEQMRAAGWVRAPVAGTVSCDWQPCDPRAHGMGRGGTAFPVFVAKQGAKKGERLIVTDGHMNLEVIAGEDICINEPLQPGQEKSTWVVQHQDNILPPSLPITCAASIQPADDTIDMPAPCPDHWVNPVTGVCDRCGGKT